MNRAGERIQRKGEEGGAGAVLWCARDRKRLGSISGGNQKLREGIGKLL
jgi:hypothetical protein